jgi:hypothetical protein
VNLTPGTRIKGPNVGLFASTDYSTSRRNYIKFSDREIFNVGTEVEATLTALSDGSAETDLFVHNAGNVSEGRKMYRINTVSFLLPGVGLDTIWTEQPRGTYLNPPSNSNSASYLRGFLSAQQPPPHPRAAAFWAGNGAGTLGLYCVPTTVEFAGDNVFTRGEHGLVSAFPSGFGSERILHINALPLHTPGNPPWTASGARLKAKWWGVRTP